MRNDIKKRNFIAQGSILAITGLLCRIIGMLYRIPLIDIIGTEGNGYYTSAYSIYNILLILSSYSLPTAISKVISVRLAHERYDDVRTVLRVAFLYATIMGGLMCSVMFFGAPYIAAFIEKPFCEYALRTLAPTIWIMAYLGVLRGYFQGSGNMIPTAVSQVLEQVVNAVISIVMAILLFDYGVKANLIYHETEYSFAYGAAGGTIGTGSGALIALLFFILLMLLYGRLPGKEKDFRKITGRSRRKESAGNVAKVLLLTLIPILVSSTVYNISTVLDDAIFARSMAYFGLAESVVFLWGVFGEYRILFNIPVAMANSLSSSVIPSLTNAVAEKDHRVVVQKLRLAIHFVMIITVPAAVGLFVLAEPICDLLFMKDDNALLIHVLRRGAPAIVLFGVSTITNGILQGLGHLSAPLKNAVIALIIHIAALLGFVYLSHDIYSVIYANTIFALIVCLLNSRDMHKHVHYRFSLYKIYLSPIIAACLMGAVVYGVSAFLQRLLPNTFAIGAAGHLLVILVCVVIAMFVYFPALVLLRAFTKEELIEMPLGTRIYRFVHKLGLM